MSIRRVWLTGPRLDGRPAADFEGMAGEQGITEVYAPYGIATGREGSGILVEFQDDPDNFMALAPGGDRAVTTESTVLYWNQTQIELTDDKVEVTLGSDYFRIENGEIRTNMDIRTTGDIFAGSVSLANHKHAGVQTGGGVSGPPQP